MNNKVTKFFLLLLMVGISIVARPQSQKQSVNLSWQSIRKEVKTDGSSVAFLYFDGATFPDLKSCLPYYIELQAAPSNALSAKIIINVDKSELVPESELSAIVNPLEIKEEIITQVNIEKENKNKYAVVSVLPFLRNEKGQIERILFFTYTINYSTQSQLKSQLAGYASQSVLNQGEWFKFKVGSDGVYKLTYDDIKGMGFSSVVNPRIFGSGGEQLADRNTGIIIDDLKEIPIYQYLGSDNTFNSGDYILFFARGTTKWSYDSSNEVLVHQLHNYDNAAYYFITTGGDAPKTVATVTESVSSPVTVNSFDELIYHEEELNNILLSGRQWLGEEFSTQLSRTFNYTLTNQVSSTPLKFAYRLYGQSTLSSSFSIDINGTTYSTSSIASTNLSSYSEDLAKKTSGIISQAYSSNDLSLTIQYNQGSNLSAIGWIDYFDINYRRELSLVDNYLLFRDISTIGTGKSARFQIEDCSNNTMVWDVSDIHNIQAMSTTLASSQLNFVAKTDSLREFVAFNYNADFSAPVIEGDGVGMIANQNLHGQDFPNMIIVTHPDFLSYANELAELHRQYDTLSVLVVTTDQIYNEFSSGIRDAAAIRNFIKMFYDRATQSSELPQYVLLFGDGSYDNRSSSSNNSNYIPTYQSESSFCLTTSFVSDDYFGLLDNNENIISGLLDVGVGRFPVRSQTEAAAMITKVKAYLNEDNRGDWQSTLCFIGDDEESNVFMIDANNLCTYVNTNYPAFITEKIFFDAYEQVSFASGQSYPDVTKAINNRVNKGALLINYIGHGGERGLAHEQVIDVSDILAWKNLDRLAVFFTATCEFSRFDNFDLTSAGEYVLLNPNGGAIAMLSTTRIVYEPPNAVLNQNFYRYIFARNSNGERYRLGDVFKLTKNLTDPGINKRNFTLLGDPALELKFPEYVVKTDSINGHLASSGTDTLKALQKARICGHLEDIQGNFLSYNGMLQPSVFDKETTVKTLSNDGYPVFTFMVQNNLLYKGKISASNGLFSYSFIIPKDIVYSYGTGKINYYANNGTLDAMGYFKNFIVGGSDTSLMNNDQEGPLINLYLNDESFVSGGLVDEDPVLIAHVSDSSGINTVGSGIGHDITAIIDNNTSSSLVLNDYYVADTNSYQQGTISYPLSGLEAGSHTVKLKVWDVLNNSSSASLDFVVENSAQLALEHVLNYPNPFTTNTGFYFEHNQPGLGMDVLVQIYTVSGKLVKTIRYTESSGNSRVGPISWDGTDDFGDRIGRGVYIYRLKVKTSTGKTADKYEKLVILK